MMQKNKIIVGMWGTTNLCLYLLDKETGEIIDTRNGPGVSKMDSRSYPDVLYALIDEWLPNIGADPIYLGGMVGSTIGWQEVGYHECPANLTSLLDQSNLLACNSKLVYIVPGLSCTNSMGEPDVLRGEEIELLAVSQNMSGTNNICIPGTHTKWVTLNNNMVESFFTCAAGETYDVIINNGVLASPHHASNLNDFECYKNGLSDIYKNPEALLSLMFSARSRTINGDITSAQAQDRLSGLLIGSDVNHALAEMKINSPEPIVHIIGSEILSKRYQIALQMRGISTTITSASTASATGLTLTVPPATKTCMRHVRLTNVVLFTKGRCTPLLGG